MAEKLTSIELDSIQLHDTQSRSLAKEDSFFSQEDDIDSSHGQIRVGVQGDRGKPAILTYHDIGLNSVTCFQGFFNYPDMQALLKQFCVYHVCAPGQQDGSLPLPQGIAFTGEASTINKYQYASMDELSEQLLLVLQHYGLKQVIGFGVGAGANVLSRFALQQPDRVEALILVNGLASKAGWTEWGYQKLNSWHLKGGVMSSSVEDYLLWHWFGDKTRSTHHDLVHVYTDYVKTINTQNLAHFIESYIKRTDLGIVRESDRLKKATARMIRRTDLGIVRESDRLKKATARMIRCPAMLVAGDDSPHLGETVAMNSRMDPESCNFIKFQCGGMILEEVPDKLAESLRLFLQGQGYIPSLSQAKMTATRTAARKSQGAINGTGNSVSAPTKTTNGNNGPVNI